MQEKKALADVTGSRYRNGKRREKTAILNEFCKSTGYNRKYAITILRNAGKKQMRRINGRMVNVKITAKTHRKRLYTPYYGEDVRKSVLAIWAFFHNVCGKRLVPMIRDNLDALFADKKLNLSADAKAKTAQISRSTVERMLKKERSLNKVKGTCATSLRKRSAPGTLLKQQIPVRTFWRWDDKKPGFTEAAPTSWRSVSHDGGFACGEYTYTLSVTDVALCWSEFRALKNKAQRWTHAAFEDIPTSFPVPVNATEMVARHRH
jgi:hypothetical protein